jgi:hypothetical protein
VILKEIAGRVLERGWLTVYANQSARLLDALLAALEDSSQDFREPKSASRIKGFSLYNVGITREFIQEPTLSWEQKMTQIVRAMTAQNIGLVFEIDEVTGKSEPLRRFASLFQTLKSEAAMVALIMAGLPHELDHVFNDKVISFVRRSRVKDAGLLEPSETYALFKQTFALTDTTIDSDACSLLVEKSGGFPFLTQLLGYECWEVNHDHVTLAVARKGIREAEPHIGASMLELILQDVSDVDLRFLLAMSEDDGESKISDIAERLVFDANKTSQYRLRLIREGIVKATTRGKIDFTIPYLRDFLRRNY